MPEKPQHPISIRLTKEELDRLDQLAKDRGTTRHDLIRQVVRKLVKLPTTEDILSGIADDLRIAEYKQDLIKKGF